MFGLCMTGPFLSRSVLSVLVMVMGDASRAHHASTCVRRWSRDRRRHSQRAPGEYRVPAAHGACVLDGRAAERQGIGMGVGRGADVVPVEHVLTERGLPA